jgi:hypothetical protein
VGIEGRAGPNRNEQNHYLRSALMASLTREHPRRSTTTGVVSRWLFLHDRKTLRLNLLVVMNGPACVDSAVIGIILADSQAVYRVGILQIFESEIDSAHEFSVHPHGRKRHDVVATGPDSLPW